MCVFVCAHVCVGLDVQKEGRSLTAQNTHTHIIYKHVSTYVRFEGTRYVEGQALFGNTHHTEFGRKTGQLSVMVEAVWIQEFSCQI